MDTGKTGQVKVAIIGAGSVGSTFAYTLMHSGLATEIVLIDKDQDLAEGEALDMNHGLFFAPPVRLWAGDWADCEGADIIVITAGAAQKPGETRLDLTRRNADIIRSIMDSITPHNDDAVFIMVTNPVDVLTHLAIRHSGLPWQQVMGSGTVLDSARFRYLLSRKCNVDARNVHAYILGEHGDSEVAAWSMVHMAGVELDDYCAICERKCGDLEKQQIAEKVRDSAYHIIEYKGATNYGIAQSLLRIVGAVIRDENSVLTVSSLVDNYMGIENVCLSVPCLVAGGGIVRQLKTDLPDDEAEKLRESASKLKEFQDQVESEES
jgi:L-lactate dehydrogenase